MLLSSLKFEYKFWLNFGIYQDAGGSELFQKFAELVWNIQRNYNEKQNIQHNVWIIRILKILLNLLW